MCPHKNIEHGDVGGEEEHAVTAKNRFHKRYPHKSAVGVGKCKPLYGAVCSAFSHCDMRRDNEYALSRQRQRHCAQQSVQHIRIELRLIGIEDDDGIDYRDRDVGELSCSLLAQQLFLVEKIADKKQYKHHDRLKRYYRSGLHQIAPLYILVR